MISRQVKLLVVFLLALSTLEPVLSVGAAEPGNSAFERTWGRTELPVVSEQISRTWMWGPEAFTGPMMEFRTDRPGVGQQVQYFDKSRMEITLEPDVNRHSIWFVTNGLLARELVTGALQIGNNDFDQRAAAQVNVAGDGDDPTGPTYASFQGVLEDPPLDGGAAVTARIDRAGNVTADPALASKGVSSAYVVPETNHSVASPFWEFMNSSGPVTEQRLTRDGPLFPNPFYATGFPISEAYWTNVKVANVYTDVLVQVFERRVLTYTPENDPGWQVEAGNVGRHYFEWRYGMTPPDYVENPAGASDQIGPSPLPDTVDLGGQASFVVANQGLDPLTISFNGPESATIELPGCPECPPFETPPTSCHGAATQQTVTLPAGSYIVSSNRAGSRVQPLAGVWTLLPDSRYGACFFTIR
ncbi:hypothetical protein BH23CHL1_BH23CHL1_17030 [soil metagenome]